MNTNVLLKEDMLGEGDIIIDTIGHGGVATLPDKAFEGFDYPDFLQTVKWAFCGMGRDYANVRVVLEARDKFVHKYAWAIPSQRAIRAICRHGPIIEMGAGTGLWGMFIRAAGGEILCFDTDPLHKGDYKMSQHNFTQVDLPPPNVFDSNPDHTLMLCWPPYDTKMAAEYLKAYKGGYFIYIGEGSGGCTADDEFFEILADEWGWADQEIPLQQWYGINDYLQIYKRGNKQTER